MRTKKEILYDLQNGGHNGGAEMVEAEIKLDTRDALVRIAEAMENVHDDLKNMRAY